MPGFRLPKRTVLVTFEEDSDYYGLEIRVKRDLPMAFLFDIQSLAAEEMENRTAETERIMRKFANDALIEWNLEDDDGNEVPANAEGFMEQSMEFASAVIGAWTSAVTRPSDPLDLPSNDGNTSKEPQE